MAAKLVVLLLLQTVLGGILPVDVAKIGEYTRDVVQALKTDYDVEKLRVLKDGVEKLLERVGDDELKNKLLDLSSNLQNPQRVIEDLEDVWRIFEKKPIDVAVEYRNVLEETLGLLTKTSKDEDVEHALLEIIDDLKTVPLDNDFVKRTVNDLRRAYIRDLEPIRDVMKDEVDCLKTDSALLTNCLEKLSATVKKGDFEDAVYLRLLSATRTLEFNIYNMCHTKIPLGETPAGFEVQIQTVANGLINAISSISIDTEETQSIFRDLVHEFVSGIKDIADRLEMRHVYNRMEVVVNDLKHVEFTNVDAVKTRLMHAVQEATMEVTKILRHKLTDDVYGIVNDYLAVLQRQTMQVQNIYQSLTSKLPIEKLGMQVQTITNGVLLYLRNVPTNDVMIREKLEVQVHHLVKRLQSALNRIPSQRDEDFTKTLRKIKDISGNFENFMEKAHITSIPEVVFHFDILAQKIAAGMKQLAWIARTKDGLEGVVRNLLSEYLIIIENIQVKIQRINQVAQVGESPRELALQMQVVSEHLRKLLVVFVTDNTLTKNVLLWQVRCLNQVLEVIVEQLQTKMVTDTGKIYRKVAVNLKNIQQLLKTHLDDSNTNVYQFRVIIGGIIRKATLELNKLTVTSHADIQEGHGAQTTFVRSILIEFLLALQDFHMQLQHNFQIVLSGQTPMKTLREIGALTNKILGLFDADMNEVIAMQLGQYAQTIENILNLLHHRMKNNGEHAVEQEKIADVLGKMSLILQNADVKDVRDVKEKLEMSMRKFMTVSQELIAMNMEKVRMMQVGTHTGILHGLLTNMLLTLRNMYLQMQYVRSVPNYEPTHELLGEIASISNNIMPALETIVGSTTPIKQALDIQVFKYARELTRVAKKLDAVPDPKVQINVQEALMVLEQTATSMATLTINEIKLHLNKLVQSVGNEILKVDKRDVLVEYLTSLKNLHLQVQRISRMSHQSENYQLVGMLIDSAVIELCRSLQNAPAHDKHIVKAIVLESQELGQLIANVINRYQAASVLQNNRLFMEIASELKTIQLHLQEMTVRKMFEDFDRCVIQVVTYVEKAAVLIEELMWMPVVTQTTGSQYRPDMPTFVRVTLHDFLTAVQNMVIQIDSVLVRVTDDKLGLISKLSHTHEDASKILYHPEMALYRGMEKSLHRTQVSDLLVTMMMDSYRDLKRTTLDNVTIRKYIEHLLVLLEEISELTPRDFNTKVFVQKMHSVYTVFKRILYIDHANINMEFVQGVHDIVTACEEFYHKLSGTDQKELLVLVKNWIGEFCSVLKHANGDTSVLRGIRMLTERVVEKLRGADEYEVADYARKYFHVLHRILRNAPESLKVLHFNNVGGAKRSFINALETVSEKLEMAKDHNDLSTSYLHYLEGLFRELNAYHTHFMY